MTDSLTTTIGLEIFTFSKSVGKVGSYLITICFVPSQRILGQNKSNSFWSNL